MLIAPLEPVADILILAGDVCLLKSLYLQDDFLDFVSANWKFTYWVPGNHEYYHANVTDRGDSFCEPIRSNVFLVNNHVAVHEDTRFLFTTLWSHISPSNELLIARSVNDFHLISYQNRRLTVPDFNRLHFKAIDFLESQFALTQTKTTVVTHHVPTLQHYPAKYINSPIQDVFACDLDTLIESSKAKYWIYGHHHANISPFSIGETILVTNQLGYVHASENALFQRAAVIEI
jgi:predicted phosphohydrolase